MSIPLTIEPREVDQRSDIERQYDEIIAQHYDRDPQSITSNALDLALSHIAKYSGLLEAPKTTLDVLDLGMGTGMFLKKLCGASAASLNLFGVDLSSRMIDSARKKLPGLVAHSGDAAAFDTYFENQKFDLISTHFITGFVPLDHLLPRIWDCLRPGGYWSYIGGTSQGYKALQRKAGHPLLQLLFKGKRLTLDGLLCPSCLEDVTGPLHRHGFEIRVSEVSEPSLSFANFNEFMEFAYTGGWLTPFVEAIGLQNASRPLRGVLNRFVFPLDDHHHIAMVLARKPLTLSQISS